MVSQEKIDIECIEISNISDLGTWPKYLQDSLRNQIIVKRPLKPNISFNYPKV